MGRTAGVGKVAHAFSDEAKGELGQWKETNILWDFGDGWIIAEDRDMADIRTMANLTNTCVAGSHITNLLYKEGPKDERPMEEREAEYIASLKAKYPNWSDSDIRYEVADWKRNQSDPVYRLAHVQDPDGRAIACILLIARHIYDGPKQNGRYVPYTGSNDLSQPGYVSIEGDDFRIAEIRTGRGFHSPPEALKRCAEWYRGATGEFDEAAFKRGKGGTL